MKITTDTRETPDDWPYENHPTRQGITYDMPSYCMECQNSSENGRYIALHSHSDNEYGPVYYCLGCVTKALALLEAAPHGMTELRNVKIKTTHDVVQPAVL